MTDAKLKQAILKIAKCAEEIARNTKKMVRLLDDMQKTLVHLIETRFDFWMSPAPGRARDPGNGEEEDNNH